MSAWVVVTVLYLVLLALVFRSWQRSQRETTVITGWSVREAERQRVRNLRRD